MNQVYGYKASDQKAKEFLQREGIDIAHEDALQAKKKAIEQAEKEYIDAIESLLVGYTRHEVDTFSKQETEARAFIIDPTSDTPFIDALCVSRDVPKQVVIDKIIAKANAFSKAVGMLTGIKQKKIDEIENA